MIDRIIQNWKTTAMGLLAMAGVIFGVLAQHHTGTWIIDSSGIVAGLTLLIAKDK